MITLRLSKILCVVAIGLFASLAAFGNITDYSANLPFVEHVMAMDSIFPDAATRYRAIHSPALQHAAYLFIIIMETLTAFFCWLGALRLITHIKSPSREFNQRKQTAIIGLTLGFLTWQVLFMSIGGEWFGMWMSDTWNGVPNAFRFLTTIILVLIFLAQRDDELA